MFDYYEGPISDHFDGKHFFLPDRPFKNSFIDILKWSLFEKAPKWPLPDYQIPETKLPPLAANRLRIVYIGHSTLLIYTTEIAILVDPQFSINAGPLNLGPKRIRPPGIALTSLPKIDVIFISHNHYDHLDMPSIQALWERDHPIIYTPLGNDTIIKKHNPTIQIISMDWNEQIDIGTHSSLQLLPSQHWSSRLGIDRNKALWGGALFKIREKTLYFAGDTGFDACLFEEIKNLINNAPDIAMLPIGSYEPRWFMSYSHMCPEEAWKAFNILKAKHFIPIHYDTFQLGNEPYGEALNKLYKASGSESTKIMALKAGLFTEFPLENI